MIYPHNTDDDYEIECFRDLFCCFVDDRRQCVRFVIELDQPVHAIGDKDCKSQSDHRGQ